MTSKTHISIRSFCYNLRPRGNTSGCNNWNNQRFHTLINIFSIYRVWILLFCQFLIKIYWLGNINTIIPVIKKIFMSSPDFIIIPERIWESATSAGYLEVTGRHIETRGFNVYLTSLVANTRGRVHILADEKWTEQEITLRFDGVSWPNGHDDIQSYSAEILLKPGRYTVRPKVPKN